MNPFLLAAIIFFVLLCGTIGFGIIFYRRFPIDKIYKSKLHLESTFDSIDEPLAIVRDDYTLSRVNKAYTKFVNKSFSQILGKKCFEVFFARSNPCDFCLMKEVRKTLQPQSEPHIEYGADRIISASFYPFTSKKGVFDTGAVEHIRDITQLQQLKENLEAKNTILETTTANLEKAQKAINEELELARQVQQQLITKKIPQISGLRIDALYNPMEAVGGDIYDYLIFSDTRIGIFLGDAAGHGLPAAMVSSMAKMSLHNHTQSDISPAALLDKMNQDLLKHLMSDHYLTVFCGIFDLEAKKFTYTRASHPKPVVVRRDGTLLQLQTSGTFVGMIDNPNYGEGILDLCAGDRIFFFTDGIYEAVLSDEVNAPQLGYREFSRLLGETLPLSFDELIPSIKNLASTLTIKDDFSFIAIEYNPVPAVL